MMDSLWKMPAILLAWYWLGCFVDGTVQAKGARQRVWCYMVPPVFMLILLILLALVTIPRLLRRLGRTVGDW